MKRTLTLLAILAAIGPAWGAEVVSSNIVGYEKVTLAAGYNMIGVQFNQVGGEALPLADVGILGSNAVGFDEDGNYASTMEIWNGNGYDKYGWSGSSGTDVLGNSALDNKWLNYDLEEEDGVSVAGSGFWISAATATEMTISGEVESDATVTANLVAGYNLVGNPFPGDVKIADFGVLDSSFAGFDEDGNYATTMEIWNGNGYEKYGWSGSSGTDVLGNAALDNKWLNYDLEEEDTLLPFGKSVWINAAKAGTITYTNPVQ